MTIAATLTAVTTAVLQIAVKIVLLSSTNEYPQTQQCMDGLCDIMETFEEDFRRAATGSQHGKNSEIAGLVMMGLGIALAPLTLGASAAVAGAGGAVDSGTKRNQACRQNSKKTLKLNWRNFRVKSSV